MGNLKDRVEECTILFYRWPKEGLVTTYHWECDFCGTKYYTAQAIVTHALVDHMVSKITIVVSQ